MSLKEDEYIPSEIILDLYEDPLNYGIIKNYDIKLTAENLGCGDKIIIYFKISKDIVKDVKFTFKGSVISKAGASLATEIVKAKSIKDIINLRNNIILEKLGGVIETRQKCVFFAIEVIKKGLFSYIFSKHKFPFCLKLEI